MTVYSLVHLVIAILCTFMAAFHLGLWFNVRADRVQPWLAGTFLGFAFLALACGGASVSSGGLGPRNVWISFGIVAVMPLQVLPAVAVELMLGQKRSRAGDLYLKVLWVVAAVRAADMAFLLLRIHSRGEVPTWEAINNSLAAPTVLLVWGNALVQGARSTQSALEDFGRKSAVGLALLLVSVPATILTVREILIIFDAADGPSLIGLIGIPFIATTSMVVVGQHRRAIADTTIDDREKEEISGYRLLRRLGRGGMGELFLATRTGPGGFSRQVALKRIRREKIDDSATVGRFLAEARLAGQLHHPNVVAVQDVGTLGGDWFIAMEYLPGVTLDDLMVRALELDRPLPIPLVVAVGEAVAKGLACAHAAGIVHRDVKPLNVMVTFAGEVKVIDFGIAFEAGRSGDRVTGAGKIVGTGPYMPPERFQGLPGEPPGDVYSLGVMLYQALTGFRPYAGRTPAELLQNAMSGRFRPLTVARPETPAALAAVIERSIGGPALDRPSAETVGVTLGVLRTRLPDAAIADTVQLFCREAWRAEQRAVEFAAHRTGMTMTATSS